MLFGSLVVGLSFVAASSASALERRAGCNADNCLRALRATQIAGRLEAASSACNSFWVHTVTPALVTETATLVSPTTITSISLTTETSTVETDTLTSTVFDVATVQGDPTSTKTVYTISNPPAKKVKRCTSTTDTFPSWASACSGAVRFTSACSCIGVTTAVTVTAPVPTTTVTSTSIVSISTTTTSTDVSSLTATSTETVTSVTSTETVGSVATAYASQFKLRVIWTQNLANERYAKIINSNGVDFLVPVASTDSPTIFSLSSTGALYSIDGGVYRAAYVPTPSSGSVGISLRVANVIPTDSTQLICSVSESDDALTCGVGTVEGWSPARWSANSSGIYVYRTTDPTYNAIRAVPA
ncbi:hypothetical protein TWF718_003533 [Orbilia javanica]|uniref:Uncharacterized protein n=1 Tax=Orbilia javanica TaxID=47235 RepID=A0AAN8RJ38_9PEZI